MNRRSRRALFGAGAGSFNNSRVTTCKSEDTAYKHADPAGYNVRAGIMNLKQSQLAGRDKGLKLKMNGAVRAACL